MVANTDLILDDYLSVEDHTTGHNSGTLFFKVVAAGTGTADGGSFIDLPNTTPPLQAQQNFPEIITDRMFGSAPLLADATTQFQAGLDYCGQASVAKDLHFSGAVTTGQIHPKRYGGIKGQGWFQSELFLLAGVDDHHIILDQSDNRWCTFENFSMDGNKDNQASLSSNGLHFVRLDGDGFTSGGQFRVHNMWVKNYNGDGIALGGRSGASHIRGTDSNFNYGNGYSNFTGDVVISDSDFHNNRLRGINESGVGWQYSNVKCWFNGDNEGVEANGDFGGTGSHTGGSSATVMTDANQALLTDMYAGKTIQNVTDGSTGTVSSNTATTITVASLSGGSGNTWEAGDEWFVAETVTRLPGFGFRGGVSPANERRGILSSCYAQENYGDGVIDNAGGIVGQIVVDGNSITYAPGEVRQSTSSLYDGLKANSAFNSTWTIHCDNFQQTLTPFNTKPNQRFGVNIDAVTDACNFMISSLNHFAGQELEYPASSPAKNNIIQINGVKMEGITQTIANVSGTARPYGITRFDASTAFTQGTLGASATAPAGTKKTFVVDDATNTSQVNITEAIGGVFTLPMSVVGDEAIFEMNSSGKWIPKELNLAPSNLVIAAGVITLSNWNSNLTNEGAAASDDLDTINGGWEGMPNVVLSPRNDVQSIVVTQVGNIVLNTAGNFTMDHSDDNITLQFRNGEFRELSRSDNNT